MGLFYKDLPQKLSISWEDFLADIRSTSEFNPYCKSDSFYTVFKQVVLSILLDEEIILLDSDFTETELIKLTGFSEFSDFSNPVTASVSFPKKKEDLITLINQTHKNWKITLFTSGTTGTPKKITHNFDSITRFVKKSENHNKDIWGFAYNPTHMAGVQVFFQALLNGNTLIRLFGLNSGDIYAEIERNNITNISATPTFYRLLFPCNKTFKSVKRITSGGEKFDKHLTQQIQTVFPNAKITNVYASTEAGSLFASSNDIFTVKPEYLNLVKIKDNELLIHNSLMGNNEFQKDNEWYHTGDLIEIISESPLSFRFSSRKNEMINVGGYKVNPQEVEEAILMIKGIKNAYVYAKKNSILGNIVCCEVVSENKDIKDAFIRKHLQENIQEFKIPRIIKFVDAISTTRTGKLKRN